MAERRKRRRAQLSSINEPGFLTLTKSPANRSPFKVIRSADGDEGKVVERSDSDLLSIDLPTGISRNDAEGIMRTFGLEDDYEIVESDGLFRLHRRGSDADAKTVKLEMGEGIVANVAVSAFQRSDEEFADACKPEGDQKKYVALVNVRFDNGHFKSVKQVSDWLDGHEVTYPEGAVKIEKDGFTVTRGDAEGETREVDLGDGVLGTICRAEAQDVPMRVYRNVLEQAYGSWGWGHIDFAAALADPIFTDKSWDALWALRDVLENIVIYSGLPLDDRKALIRNACNSYADYMSALLDALPRGVIEQARSDKLVPGQEGVMPKQKTETKGQKSVEADTTQVERNDTTTDDKTKTEEQFVTRAELEDVVGSAVTTALRAAGIGGGAEGGDGKEGAEGEGKATTAKRSEEQEGEQAEEGYAKLATALDVFATKMGEMVTGVQTEIKTLRSDMDEYKESVTVTRSTDSDDAGDGGAGAEGGEGGNVFAGIFSQIAPGR